MKAKRQHKIECLFLRKPLEDGLVKQANRKADGFAGQV